MPRKVGHSAGVKAARRIVEACAHRGIETLTLFAFSSENWNRPPREVSSLMALFVEVLQREVEDLCRNNVRLRFIGQREVLDPKLQRRMREAEDLTSANGGLNLVIAVAYGGRWDLAQAVRSLAADIRSGQIDTAEITQDEIAARLVLADMPDPDLFIRTGGEQRISNFLLWQLAYTELYFTDVLWPDFDEGHLDTALGFFANRQRRFGRVVEHIEA